jgi:hypothetical protein
MKTTPLAAALPLGFASNALADPPARERASRSS